MVRRAGAVTFVDSTFVQEAIFHYMICHYRYVISFCKETHILEARMVKIQQPVTGWPLRAVGW